MLSSLDGNLRAADRLAVAEQHLAGLELSQGNLVTGRNRVAGSQMDPIDAQLCAGGNRDARHGDVIGRMKMNRRILGGWKLGDFEQHDGSLLLLGSEMLKQ